MKERNLYFETIEALFYNGKTPKDIDNVRFTNNFGITTIISWGNFADAARKFNYNTDAGEREIDPIELSSFGEDLFKYMEIGTGEETYYD